MHPFTIATMEFLAGGVARPGPSPGLLVWRVALVRNCILVGGMVEGSEENCDSAPRRAYGVLATGLSEAVGEARDALSEHAPLLPDGRVQEIDGLLLEFEQRRVRVAFYGEVKAGKSTLLNALAGRELSPSAFDPMTSVPVRITYGAETVWRVGDHSFGCVDEVARLMRLGAQEADEVVVETPVDLLRLGGQVDLIDTPGVGSDDRADQISTDVLRSLDAVVLVVRYPALFTKVTRQLMAELESDIGKLFVVWNLDADCADLGSAELRQHADQLRADVAGAHELYLVDARAGLRGREANDASATADSGLDEFVSALGRFASSDKRQVAALREAAKRVDRWFDEAQKALAARRDHLRIKLEETQTRLTDVAAAAEAEQTAAQDQFDHLQSSLELAEKDREAGMRRCAAFLRKSLRASRRTWAKSGEIEPLRVQLAAASRSYEDGAQTVCGDFAMAIARAASEFGSEYAADAPQKQLLSPDPIAPDDRLEAASRGKAQWLRRAVWRRWFLPGVAAMEGEALDRELADRADWGNSLRQQAISAMRELLQERLVDILQRADAEDRRIKDATDYDAETAELDLLEKHVPLVTAHRQRVAEINREAWKLVGE